MKEHILYLSPRTGFLYEAKLNTKGYTRYDITLDGKWVQFSLSEEGIAKSVANAEGITDGVYSSRFD